MSRQTSHLARFSAALCTSLLALAAAGSTWPEGPPSRIDIRVLSESGKTLARAVSPPADLSVQLRYYRSFNRGDKIVILGRTHMRVRVCRMRDAHVYCPKRVLTFSIPFDADAQAYPSFAGSRHYIYAAAVAPADLAQLGQQAINPYDRLAAVDTYPHASTNSVCRQESVFAARNAIDGQVRFDGHGRWPHQSWGPDRKPSLWWRVDFGREVEVHSIDVWLRADVPHDGFFRAATAVFSDGTRERLEFMPKGAKQIFRIRPRNATWLRLEEFALPSQSGWCAVTEVGAWGREASAYVKKGDWRATVTSQFHIGPAYVLARAMQDFAAHRQRLEIAADWVEQDGIAEADTAALARRLRECIATAGLMTELASVKPFERDCAQLTALYLQACERRRQARLAPHRDALRRVVFTKHYDLGGSHYAYTEGQSDAQAERHFRAGASLCMLELDGLYGQARTLLDDRKGVIRDPDVSWDAQRVLFAWKKSDREDDYHLYELRLRDGHVRQITHGLGFADCEGAYLPNGHLVFNSTRCVQTVDCWWTEVSNLFTCDGDGRFLRRLGYDQVHTNFPTVTPDGRVIYTRWDYNDRGQIYPQGLFQMHPDGTGQTEVYGNNSWFPTSILHARQIPDSRKIAAILSGHHTRQRGWLGIIDPGMGRQEAAGAQLIAPVRETLAVHVDAYGQSGHQFQYPWPLSETEFLVALRPAGSRRFAIYLVAADGPRELLASDPGVSCNQPVPLAARALPHVRPSAADYRKSTGTFYMQDIRDGPGLEGVKRGAVKELRVIALEYRAAGVGRNGNSGPAGGAMISTPVSIRGSWDLKRLLGSAEVYDDGSACFTVPSRTPVYFQALDAKGHAVQTMRSWATLQPGETFSCVGCHESKNSAPRQAPVTLAMRAGPQALAHPDGPVRCFSFVHDVQPILDRHCVRCHCLDQTPKYSVSERVQGEPLDPKTMRIVVPCEAKATWRYTLDKPANAWLKPEFDDAKWKTGRGGFGRPGTPGALVGTQWHTKEIWLRRTFDLQPDALPPTPALLCHHDEDVEVYINGMVAVRAGGYTVRYEVLDLTPQALAALKPGRNIMAVHCRQTVGGQYIDAGIIDRGGKPKPLPKHAPQGPKMAFSLKGSQTFDPLSLRKWSDAYKALANRGIANWISPQSVPSMLPPYHAGAATSRLIKLLERGHNNVKLSSEDLRRIATWIDLLVPYCGTYTEGLEGEHLAKYQHFAAKRRRWEEVEDGNIDALVRQGATRP